MNRLVAEKLRAAADRVEQLPAHLPDPSVEVAGSGHIHAHWRHATAEVGRRVLEALPGDWHTSDSFMYRNDEGPVTMWWIYFEQVKPVSSVNPADLLAEVAS